MAQKAGFPIFVPDLVRTFFLAGLGAITSGAEEAQKTYEKWVKKGEVAQKEWERALEDFRGRITRKGLEKSLRGVRSKILKSSTGFRDRAKEARTTARKRIQRSLSTVGLIQDKPEDKAAQ